MRNVQFRIFILGYELLGGGKKYFGFLTVLGTKDFEVLKTTEMSETITIGVI